MHIGISQWKNFKGNDSVIDEGPYYIAPRTLSEIGELDVLFHAQKDTTFVVELPYGWSVKQLVELFPTWFFNRKYSNVYFLIVLQNSNDFQALGIANLISVNLVAYYKPIAKIDLDSMLRVFDINLSGSFLYIPYQFALVEITERRFVNPVVEFHRDNRIPICMRGNIPNDNSILDSPSMYKNLDYSHHSDLPINPQKAC